MTSSAAGPWLYFALGCAATVTAMQLLSMGDGVRGLSTAKTTLGREKTRGEKAFILAVELRFRDTGSAQELVSAWTTASDFCMEKEPYLFHYEVSRSDKDPLRYMIYERYRSKADYLGPHKESPAFLAFRPIMKAMQDIGAVNVTGESWN
eukprot:CAMPEP_0179456958 /NCGR_PEP_ID=MMETSP0799-20121207/40822_1 /TAXON_ID=46947 /ORGANISM="Geminigera cryophila, Strain CCMP2564" /LENGTH=149 /DNA_ID=CAMNT_0021257357 /DNA_START=447 /DNA_END=893 /DNA_ORIENTATION=-